MRREQPGLVAPVRHDCCRHDLITSLRCAPRSSSARRNRPRENDGPTEAARQHLPRREEHERPDRDRQGQQRQGCTECILKFKPARNGSRQGESVHDHLHVLGQRANPGLATIRAAGLVAVTNPLRKSTGTYVITSESPAAGSKVTPGAKIVVGVKLVS